MKTDIKGVIHLYYGQMCKVSNSFDHDGEVQVIDYNLLAEIEDEDSRNFIQPILRRLSSITEDEGVEIFGDEWTSDSPNARDVIYNLTNEEELRLTADETFGLLENGFWLWSTDAFDKGLIIERK